jgi:hypothetical protein
MKLLIISAPFSSDRRISAMHYAEQTDMPYEVLEGINGDTINRVAIPIGIDGAHLTNRMLACYMSHIRALEIAASSKERCIIVEDDWKPLLHASSFRTAVNLIPQESDYTVLHGLDFPEAPGKVVLSSPGWERMSPPPIIALAYIPGPDFIIRALHHAYPIHDHVDHYYRNLCIKNNLRCYRANPGIVTGAGFQSTLGH